MIHDNLNDTNLSYLKLVYPIIEMFERTNQFFQKKEADSFDSCEEVDILCKSLKSRIQNKNQEAVVPELTNFSDYFQGYEPIYCCDWKGEDYYRCFNLRMQPKINC